jgi:hypothetical protein
MTGVGASIIGDAHPVASGIMTGTQWAVLGTTYWFTRRVVVRAWGGDEQMTPTRKVAASTIASLPAGALMGLATKSKAMPSSMLFCGVVAGGGQLLVNSMASRKKKDEDEDSSIFDSKWSPLKRLTDSEYSHMMGEKMLKVEADIALIDERIAMLREQEKREAQSAAQSNTGAAVK